MVKSIHLDTELRGQFRDALHRDIIPFMRLHESRRIQRLCIALTICAIFLFLSFLIIKSGYGTKHFPDDLQAAIFLAILGPIIYTVIKKSFENELKKTVMPIILKSFGNFEWSKNSSINDIFLSSSKLFGEFTSRHSDDNFKGTYHDLNVSISETCLMRGNGKNKTTVFKGLATVSDMNKNFHGKTIIIPSNKKGAASNELRGLEKVSLEDPEFEELYSVYSNDQVEARYLLTPTFIERYKNIKKVFKTGKISCAFTNNQILIAIESRKDFFSIAGLFKPLTDIKQFSVLFEEFASILTLIDVLKLNMKIGL